MIFHGCAGCFVKLGVSCTNKVLITDYLLSGRRISLRRKSHDGTHLRGRGIPPYVRRRLVFDQRRIKTKAISN